MLFLLLSMIFCTTILHASIATTNIFSEQNFSTTAAVAISVTVVIVLLAVITISGIVFYFCFNKKKVRGINMTR